MSGPHDGDMSGQHDGDMSGQHDGDMTGIPVISGLMTEGSNLCGFVGATCGFEGSDPVWCVLQDVDRGGRGAVDMGGQGAVDMGGQGAQPPTHLPAAVSQHRLR
eukprot:363208-Chlamydomonas_euryale.AAC.9